MDGAAAAGAGVDGEVAAGVDGEVGCRHVPETPHDALTVYDHDILRLANNGTCLQAGL